MAWSSAPRRNILLPDASDDEATRADSWDEDQVSLWDESGHDVPSGTNYEYEIDF